MASSDSGEIESQSQEVQQIKADYGDDCRVITQIGDFTHVLDIKLKCHLDVHIKFQLEVSYPTSAAHLIVKSKNMQAEDVNALTAHLQAYAIQHQGEPLVQKVMAAAQGWLAEQPTLLLHDTPDSVRGERRKKKRSPKSCRKKQQEEQIANETKDKKLSSMKTAIDVVSRIQWDESLDSGDFIIGYLDRMLGVIEKRFAMFSWEDVASVDYNTLAIPKHRIQYFKFKGIAVWDKNKRLDDVFGSTGGKTIDEVIAAYNEDHPHPVATLDGTTVKDSGEDSDDDDDDDDGITIDTGFQEQKGPVETEQEAGWKPEDSSYWGPKKRPTHFVCLRITNPDVVAAVAKTNEVILNLEPSYADCIIPSERIHITLACLGLDTPDQVNHAANILQGLKEELMGKWQPQNLSVDLTDIGNFFNSVLYAKVTASDQFYEFVEHLRTSIVAKGIEIRDVFDFTPHMTLVKLKRQIGREVLHTLYLDQRLYSSLAGSHFGTQPIDNIHLCDMSNEREPNGFYITQKMITFP